MEEMQALVAEAQKLSADGKHQEAAAKYDQVIEMNDEIAEVHLMKGVSLSHAGEDDEALDAFQRTIELKKDLVAAYVNAGNILKRKDENAEAIKYYSDALKLDNKISAVWGNLCHCLNMEGECEESLRMSSKALKKLKDYSRQLHNERIYSFFKLDRPDESLDDVETILENEPMDSLSDDARSLYCLILSQKGSRLLGKGDAENALPYLKRAAEGDASSGNLFPFGVCLSQLGKDDEAIPILKKALKLDPDNWRIMVALGTIYMRNGDFEKAQKLFEKALDHDEPAQDPNIHFNNAVALINLGRPEEAEDHLKFVLDNDPDNYHAMGLLGTLYLEDKQYDKAIDVLERAVKHPDAAKDSSMHYNLGYAKLMANHPDEALRDFKKSAKIDPSNEKAALAVKQLSPKNLDKEMSKKAIEEAAKLGAGKQGKAYTEIMKRVIDARTPLERIQALLTPQEPSFRPRRPSLEAITFGFVGAASTVFDEITVENLEQSY